MHIILPSDSFPPGSVGGSAWSAHTLARALLARGHGVTAVVPRRAGVGSLFALAPRGRAGPDQTTDTNSVSEVQLGSRERGYPCSDAGAPPIPIHPPAGGRTGGGDYAVLKANRYETEDAEGVPIVCYSYYAPSLPFLQNYFSHERLWGVLAAYIVQCVHEVQGRGEQEIIIHAQHVRTIPAAVLAARQTGLPVVSTVRDHWPWDYFATGLHGNRIPYPYPVAGRRAWAALMTDLPARLGALPGVLALPALPYLLAHIRRRAALLARSDAVVAVSSYIAQRLQGVVPPDKLYTIPNMVNMAAVEQATALPPQHHLPARYLLYVGKLERNKGALLLGDIAHHLRTMTTNPLPELVVVGSGSCQAHLERQLATARVPARFLSWVGHDEVLRLMQRCTLLLFPSAWGEPLSRVLLEGSAAGAPILAMPTGGTGDILTDRVNGAIERTCEGFARRLLWLLAHPNEGRRMGEQASHIARQRFATTAGIPRYEQLYEQLLRQQ